MGGITALLLLAVGGMTYGWKPDGRGGVEYIIQIPPDQLEEVRRSGSISSVIDPAVRGHVSRVVLQVGDEPLPRELPATLASRIGDAADVPIPELDSSSRIASARLNADSSQSVMKPQAGDTQGGFPLPPSLAGGAASPRVDTANAGNGMDPNARLVIPPPATRTPNSTTLPPFTGNNGVGGGTSGQPGMATTRLGGPSTDPATAQQRNWSAQGQGTSGVPSTDPVSGSDATFPPASNLLNPGDTFGMTPSGVAGNPSLGSGVNNPGASMGTASTNYGVNNPAYSNPNMSGMQGNTLPNTAQPTNTAQPNTGTFANGAPTSEPNPFRTRGSATTGANANGAANGRSPQLTAEQRAAGAWSVDIYGNPIDRQGYPVNVPGARPQTNNAAVAGPPNMGPWNQTTTPPRGTTNPNYGTNVGGGAGGLQTQSSQFANAGGSARPSTDPFANPSNSAMYGGERRSDYANRPLTNPPRDNSSRTQSDYGPTRGSSGATPAGTPVVNTGMTDPPSLNSPSGKQLSQQRAREQGTQPMVTWLLLISFVSNVYLIFWMKKLLVRYRDLVAAKRVSDSRATA